MTKRTESVDWLPGETYEDRFVRKLAEEQSIVLGEICNREFLNTNGYSCNPAFVRDNFPSKPVICRHLINEGECPAGREIPVNIIRYRPSDRKLRH